MEKILDFCEISGSSVKRYEGKRKYIATGDVLDNKIISFEEVDYEHKPSRANQNVEIGDVIFAKMQNTKKVIIITKENVNNIYSTGFYVIKPKENVTSKFLFWLFNSKKFNYDKDKNCNGATQKAINNEGLNKIKIKVLPTIQEQLEIINKLDKVQEIIDIRKEQIKQLDELIKSQFVEMFGNVKEKVKLGDCCDVHARIGWQSLTKNEHMKNGEYMLITGTDFKNNEIDYTTCVYVSKERYEMDKNIILKNDDILITKDGTIGKVAIVHNLQKPATLNGGVFVIRPSNFFNKEYISYVFKGHLFTEFVNKSKTGATIKHLNQKHLIEFEIPMPTLEGQKEFSDIVKQIDKQKFEIQKSLEEMKKLQESLMNKYFG